MSSYPSELMAMRVLAGLALWLALAAFPVLHFGPTASSVSFALIPIPFLGLRRAPAPFLIAFLPLAVLHPDLFSPRVHGLPGLLGIAGLLAGYLVLILRGANVPGPRGTSSPDDRRGAATALVATAAALGSAAVLVPHLAPVKEALRQGYPAVSGAASVLLAIAVLALTAGLVLAYLAAPLDEAARGRS